MLLLFQHKNRLGKEKGFICIYSFVYLFIYLFIFYRISGMWTLLTGILLPDEANFYLSSEINQQNNPH